MFFSGKKLNKIDRYVRRADLTKKQYVYHAGQDESAAFAVVGFPQDVVVGDTILPREIGPVSKFNSEGKWVTHKDQPLVSRVVGQRVWRWKEFRGRYDSIDREKIIDDERLCYPRTFLAPPALEMSVQLVAGRRRLITELPEHSDPDLLRHAVNLYLEFFGNCYLTDIPDEAPIIVPRRLNWRILPPGDSPWEKVAPAVGAKVSTFSDDMQFIISERQRFICSLGPSEVFVGEGGFSAYLAYIFDNKAVLESVCAGNAIYVFDGDWRSLSQLTKRQILSENLESARIIHATGWPERLVAVLK